MKPRHCLHALPVEKFLNAGSECEAIYPTYPGQDREDAQCMMSPERRQGENTVFQLHIKKGQDRIKAACARHERKSPGEGGHALAIRPFQVSALFVQPHSHMRTGGGSTRRSRSYVCRMSSTRPAAGRHARLTPTASFLSGLRLPTCHASAHERRPAPPNLRRAHACRGIGRHPIRRLMHGPVLCAQPKPASCQPAVAWAHTQGMLALQAQQLARRCEMLLQVGGLCT